MVNYPMGRLFWNHTQVVLSLVDSIYRAVIRPFGLAVIEWHVVNELYADDGQRPSDLAHRVGRAATSFTAILDGLEHKAWIERRRDIHDRRVVRIHLTDQAYHQQAGMEACVHTIDTQLLLQLTAGDLVYIQSLQQKLVILVAT